MDGAVKALVKRPQRLRIFERDGWRCQYCGTQVFGRDDASVDHILPQVLGGAHSDDNLRTACRPCNCTKQSRSVEWLRMFRAFSMTAYAPVLTLAQYHQLKDMGVPLDPLPPVAFFYERTE